MFHTERKSVFILLQVLFVIIYTIQVIYTCTCKWYEYVSHSNDYSSIPPIPPYTTAFLPLKPRPVSKQQTDYDGAEPGAGSVAADNLLRLSGYFGGEDGAQLRRKAAEHLAAAFARPETPQAFPEMTAALVTAILGPKQVCLVSFNPMRTGRGQR